MNKEFRFSFNGSRNDFGRLIARLRPSCENEGYIFAEKDGVYRFGVAPGDHGRGYWFVPEFREQESKLLIEGRIRFLNSQYPFEAEKLSDKLEEISLSILFAPLILISATVRFIRKLLRKPQPADETEVRLFRLMIDILGCSVCDR